MEMVGTSVTVTPSRTSVLAADVVVTRESGRSTVAGNFRKSTVFVGVLTDVLALRIQLTMRHLLGGVKSFTFRSVASSVY